MPVKAAVFKHRIALSTDFVACHKYQRYSQQHHTNNDVQAVQAGYGVVEPEEDVEAWIGVEQSIRVGVEFMVKLGPPFKILVDQKGQTSVQGTDQ